MKNELQRHKKSDKVKWTLTAIGFVLVAVMLAGVCLQLFGKGKVQPSEWFKKDETQTEQVVLNPTDKESKIEIDNANNITIAANVLQSSLVSYAATETEESQISSWICSAEYNSDDGELNIYIECDSFGSLSLPLQITFHFAGTNSFDLTFSESDSCNFDYYNCDFLIFPGNYAEFLPGVEYTLSVTVMDTYAAENEYYEDPDYVSFPNLYTFNPSGVTLAPFPKDPVKEGYTFVGWYYGTEEEHGEKCYPYSGELISEDTDFHAHWTINTYTVTYNSVGGTDVNNATVNWNTAAPIPAVTRTGYNFLGWYTESGNKYNGESITSNITLIAHWEVIMLTVTFYVENEVFDTMEVAYGTSLAKAVSQASIYNLQVTSVRLSSGAPIINLSETEISEDVDIEAQVMTGADKLKNTVKNHWLTIVLSAASVVLLILVICAFTSRKKSRKR